MGHRSIQPAGHEASPTETSPLLKSVSGSADVSGDCVASDTRGTWSHEARVIASYSAPLIVTFLLQYSVDASSLIAAGRLGKVELGAVSRACKSP